MANSKTLIDTALRAATFDAIDLPENFKRISNQSYGVVFEDANGASRMIELRAIVRKIDEDMDGAEMLDFEAQEYADKVAEKEAKRKQREEEKAAKIERDKAKREAAKKNKSEE